MAVIYIVEDDKNISEIESYALKNSGYTVDTFENAKTFWSIRIRERSFCCIRPLRQMRKF